MRRAVLLAVLAGIALADGGHDQDVDYPQVGGGTYRTYTNTQETLLTLRSLKAIPAGTPKLKTTFSAPVRRLERRVALPTQ